MVYSIWARCTIHTDLLVSIDGKLLSPSGLYLDSIGRRREIKTGLIPGGYKGKYLRTSTGIIGERYIHRIVGGIFIPNPNNKPQINHRDKNEHNNSVENLEWVTGSENQLHSHKHIQITVVNGKRIFNAR